MIDENEECRKLVNCIKSKVGKLSVIRKMRNAKRLSVRSKMINL